MMESFFVFFFLRESQHFPFKINSCVILKVDPCVILQSNIVSLRAKDDLADGD